MREFKYRLIIATFLGVLIILMGASAKLKQNFLKAEELRAILLDIKKEHVFVAAHRGDWRNHPENSIAAFESCIEKGIEIIEMDIRMSFDRDLMCFHDKTLDRMTNGTGKITHQSTQNLKNLWLTNPHGVATRHRIPTLKEALSTCKGKALVMLDKAEQYIPEVTKVVKDLEIGEQCIVFIREKIQAKKELEKYQALTDEGVIWAVSIKEEPIDSVLNYIQNMEEWLNPPIYAVHFKDSVFPLKATGAAIKKAGAKMWTSPLWPSICGGMDDDRAVKDPQNSWGSLIASNSSILCTDRPLKLQNFLHNNSINK